jgi:hypothetical protein
MMRHEVHSIPLYECRIEIIQNIVSMIDRELKLVQ